MPFIIKLKTYLIKAKDSWFPVTILTNPVALNLNYCWYELWSFLVLTGTYYLVLNFLAAQVT